MFFIIFVFFFSSRRRHTRSLCDWSSDVCSSDLPRSFRNLDGRAGRMRREKIRGSDRIDVSLQFSQNRFQPRWALEPPVAKEFRVERRDDDAGSARGLLMLMESLEDQRCKMVRMGGASLLRSVGVVGQ